MPPYRGRIGPLTAGVFAVSPSCHRAPLLFEATSTRILKRTLLGLLLLAALFIVASSALHPGRAERLSRLTTSSARLSSLMRETERHNERLTAELRGLEHGPEGWQALARKELGMLREGEFVFRFPPAEHETPVAPLLRWPPLLGDRPSP